MQEYKDISFRSTKKLIKDLVVKSLKSVLEEESKYLDSFIQLINRNDSNSTFSVCIYVVFILLECKSDSETSQHRSGTICSIIA